MFSGPLRHYWSTHRGTRQVLRTRPQCLGHRTGSFLERLFLQQYALPLYRSSHTLPLLPVTHRPTGDKRDDIRNSQIWDYKIFFIGEWCEKTILSFLLQQRWWKKYSDYITLQVKVLHTNCTHYAEKAPFKVSYFHKYCWNVITDFIC